MGVHTDCLNVWYVDKSENTAVMLHETVVVIQGKSVKSNGSIYTELIIKWEKILQCRNSSESNQSATEPKPIHMTHMTSHFPSLRQVFQ